MSASLVRMTVHWVLCAVLLSGGCNQADRALCGGTAGQISIGGRAFADLQVNVFANETVAPRRIAFGVSDHAGQFTLIDDDGQSAITLPSGSYRLTVESVAADPIPVSPQYRATQTTPLLVEWSGSDVELVVEVH